MRFMNSWDIDRACSLYETHPVLGPASQTIRNLEVWTNRNSDGWAYWPKPCRAAAKLMELIERDGTNAFHGGPRPDATVEEYKVALRPVKSFRTRFGADFEIVPPVAERLEELRKQLRAECISYGELIELQNLAGHIDPSDVELLEAAGVPEFS